MFDDIICMNRYGETVRSLTQWDLDQTLYIYNTNYPVAPLFHYSNQNTEKALMVRSQYVEGVLQCVVPNQLMIEPYPITCYLFIPETEKGGTVVGMFKIPVRPRPQPNDFEYEDNVDVVNLEVLAAEVRAAELVRQHNESLRISAESERVSNEETRIANENERISNENTRIANENTRISNEADRQTAYSNMVAATTRCNNAADAADAIVDRYDEDMATVQQAITAAGDAADARDAAIAAKNDAETAATNAATSETNAADSADAAEAAAAEVGDKNKEAEGWAAGTQDGVPVQEGSPYWHNNAEYWAGKAQAIAAQELGGLNDVALQDLEDKQVLTYDDTTDTWVNGAGVHPEEITYDDYQALSQAEKASKRYLITDYPDEVVHGHVIKDSTMVSYTQRPNLVFINAELEDDPAHNATVVRCSGGGASAYVDDVYGADVTTHLRTVSLTWSDPTDVSVSGVVLTRWKNTTVVRKEGSAPTDVNDGTVIVVNTTRNAYASTPYVDDTVDYGITYYYRFFPCTTENRYTNGTALSVIPDRIELTTVPTPSTVYYNGAEQSPAWEGYDPEKMTISGQTEETNVGTYSVFFTPTANYKWSDGSAFKEVEWEISKEIVSIPTQVGNLIYNGSQQTPTWNYDSTLCTLTESPGIAVGTYSSTFTLIDTINHKFEGTDNTSVNVVWRINDALITPPTVSDTEKTYDGTLQSVTVGGYDTNVIQITGTSGTNVGDYTVTMHLIDQNYQWDDETTADKTVPWSIAKAQLSAPVVTDTEKTYNGSTQHPTVTGYDSRTMSMTGYEYTIVGSYTLAFTLVDSDNYEWVSGAVTSTSWSIAKAQGSITLSPTSLTVNSDTPSKTIAVNYVGDGTVTITSSDASLATVSPTTISAPSNVTVTGKGTNGSVTITVTLADGTNYTGATKTCSVTCDYLILATFAAATDEQLVAMIAAADAGQIDLYDDAGWRVGQERTFLTSNATIPASGAGWEMNNDVTVNSSIKLVLMHKGGMTLKTPVKAKGGSTRTTCSFVIGTNTHIGTSTKGVSMLNEQYDIVNIDWMMSEQYAWANDGFYNIIPSSIRGIFKQFMCPISGNVKEDGSWVSNYTDTIYTTFAPPSEYEMFGTHTKEMSGAGSFQFERYKTSSNRHTSSTPCWLRNPQDGTNLTPKTTAWHNWSIAKSDSASAMAAHEKSRTAVIRLFGCI